MSRNVKITHYDTAMALIEIGSVRLLTDPVLDVAGSCFDHGPVHLEKTSDRATTVEGLGRIDAILLSHDQHADNLDVAGRALLPKVPKVLTTPIAASRLSGVNVVGLKSWKEDQVIGPDGDQINVMAVPAQHGPPGTEEATGPVTGFMINWSGNTSGPIYISGDTVPFSGTDEIARRFAPVGLAILNLGRVQLAPMGDLTFSLSAEQAAAYAELLKAKTIVPLHYEGWAHFTEGRTAAASIFAHNHVADRVHWLTPGVTTIFEL